MTTIAETYLNARAQLVAIGIDTAALDARVLICHALDITHEEFVLRGDVELDDLDEMRIDDVILQRLARRPVAKIIGYKEFYGLRFHVSDDTLDPRPDSETLIDAVLAVMPDRAKPYRILDLGTGTGCLILALLHVLPHAHGVGVDLSLRALAVARENALRLELANAVDFIHSDWFAAVTGSFDIIVSNPPYIAEAELATLAPEVREYDPVEALTDHGDGLSAYRQIIAGLAEYLKPDGLIAFEVGRGQAAAIVNFLKDQGFADSTVTQDLAGIDRVVVAKRL